MKKLILSMVFVFAFVAVTPVKANNHVVKANELELGDLRIEKQIQNNTKFLSIDNRLEHEYVELCATVAFKGANAVEAASGGTFTFEEWKVYFDLINSICLNMQ